jgi:hypothetical protein
MAKPKPVVERVREYLGRKLAPPEIAPLPGGLATITAPARFEFSGEHAEERERLARAAAKTSGIVPTPEDLTAEAMAMIEQANAEIQGGPPGGQEQA